jgi:hypothetical protein
MGSVAKVKKPGFEPEVWIERMYMTESRRKPYVALEMLDLIFDERILPDVIRMWEGGLSIPSIAKAFNRKTDEITCLIMSLAIEDRIKPRPGGALGREIVNDPDYCSGETGAGGTDDAA